MIKPYYSDPCVTLYHGDCLDIMPQLPDKSIDMILCDLPYGTTACKWDTVIPLEPLWTQYKRIIKDNRAIVLTASQPFTSILVMSNINYYKCQWIWNKKFSGNFANCKYHPMKVTEEILVFGKDKILYNPQMINRKEPIKAGGMKKSQIIEDSSTNWIALHKTYDQKYPINILDYPRKLGVNILHPTEKPVPLFEYLIKTYTDENGTVLDNCAGSGTTGVACINQKRKCILIEKEEKYCEVSTKRCQQTVMNLKQPTQPTLI
jgi:site-specific DNA-methyltransferase (adenine-specific)